MYAVGKRTDLAARSGVGKRTANTVLFTAAKLPSVVKNFCIINVNINACLSRESFVISRVCVCVCGCPSVHNTNALTMSTKPNLVGIESGQFCSYIHT